MNNVKPLELEVLDGLEVCPSAHMAKRTPPPSELAEIGDRLAASQAALGLMAAEVCRATGIKPNTYSQWLSGASRPQLDEAMKLCRVLGYTLDWIYQGKPEGLPFSIASKLGLAGPGMLHRTKR